MKAGEQVLLIFVTAFATAFGILLFGFGAVLLILIAGFGLAVVYNLYEKYFAEPEHHQAQPKQEGWKCARCQRINSPRVKICTRCGFERNDKLEVQE
jgi:uncharacterized paraquat-inducible protein A